MGRAWHSDKQTRLQKLARELERGRLEADAPRRMRQHEAKVDVDYMTVIVQQQVAVVTILELCNINSSQPGV